MAGVKGAFKGEEKERREEREEKRRCGEGAKPRTD